MDKKIFKAIRKLLESCNSLIIGAGAGMGVDSGLPDFRGKDGLYKAYPPLAKLNVSFAEIANPWWFIKDPDLAWAFYGHRLNLYRRTTPHKGFFYLLKIAQKMKLGYFVFTSNVDGQFQKAGFNENNIVECHGSIHYMQCLIPCSEEIWDATPYTIEVDEKTLKVISPLPSCKNCSAVARPNILMFNDLNWIYHRTYEQELKLSQWLSQENLKPLIIEIGAGIAVPTVRLFCENLSKKLNAPLIRINPGYPKCNGPGISIPLTALEAISKIYEIWEEIDL